MIVLAKPDPFDMVQAIQKAISMLPKIDPQDMHLRVSKLSEYMWFQVCYRMFSSILFVAFLFTVR